MDGLEFLHSLGFRAKIPPLIREQQDYLAGTDQERAYVLHQLFLDPEVAAIMAVRGGFGSLRILPLLDMDLIRQHPKIVVGFSDITVLLSAITGLCRMVTFHGPMLTTLAKCDADSRTALINALTGPEPIVYQLRGLEILRSGMATGRLLGGNLTNLVHLIATPYEISWQDAILFLEDIGEAPYRLDRMLTHLAAAGRLAGLRGLILGSFTDCGDKERLWERALELIGDQGIPVWANFPAGHGTGNQVLPLGLEVEMDSNQGRLRFLSPGVRWSVI